MIDDDANMLCRLCPLHVAVLQDNAELAGLLLQHGAQVDCADKKGLLLLCLYYRLIWLKR